MKATRIEHDIIIGVANGNVDGVELPDNVPVERLRVARNEAGDIDLLDIEKFGHFYIDAIGQKHLTRMLPEWQPLTCSWDAQLTIADGAWRVRSGGDELLAAKAHGRKVMADLAEQQRQRYVTSGASKASVYLFKRDEAKRFQSIMQTSGENPPPEQYPWMSARATRLNISMQSVSDAWNAKATSWEAIGQAIENAYEAAVEAIDALTNAATADADVTRIVDGIRWS